MPKAKVPHMAKKSLDSETVVVKIITEFSNELCHDAAVLFTGAGWIGSVKDGGFLRQALPGSCAVAGAFVGNRLIGIARALSDGFSDAYIQDVTTAKEYRGRGIGSQLVECLVHELRARGIDWIGLVGVPGTEKFYPSLGFEPQDGYTLYLRKP